MTKLIHPITFIDKLVKRNELGQPFKLMDHQREVLRLAFDFDQDGRLPWDTILYSCVKKSGKTTLNGALTLAWAFTQEAPNEILILANDLEQSLARVFKTMEGIIEHNPELQREAEVQSKAIYLDNGTVITPISGDYAGAAGSNHGFVSYDELRGTTLMAIKKLASGWYQIDFRDRSGIRHRESFETKKKAQEALEDKHTAVRKGEYIAPKEIPTFKAMAELWFDAKKVNAGKHGRPVKETTLDHWKNHIDGYLIPAFGEYRLDQITTPAIEKRRLQWRDDDKLSPITVNKLLTTMTAVFNEAVRLGNMKHNPAQTAQRLGVGSVEAGDGEGEEVRTEEVYNAEELNRLIQNAEPGFYRTLILTVAMTGMRHGEALALQWGDISAGKIMVRRTWPDKWREEEPIFYVPKSKNGVREIPITAELSQALKRWKIACPVSKWDLVFPKKDGAPQDRKTVLRSGLYPAIRKAEIKKLDMHALRHTFASLLLSQGTPITEVSSYLGHADPQITLKVYSHWIPRTKTDSISRLAGMIFGAKQNSEPEKATEVESLAQ